MTKRTSRVESRETDPDDELVAWIGSLGHPPPAPPADTPPTAPAAPTADG